MVIDFRYFYSSSVSSETEGQNTEIVESSK